MVALDSDRLRGTFGCRCAVVALYLNSKALLEGLRWNSDIETLSRRAKHHALAAVKCNLGNDSIIGYQTSTDAILHIVITSHLRNKSRLGCICIDIDKTSQLLLVIASKHKACNLLAITCKLNLKPAAYALQCKLCKLALRNHKIIANTVAILSVVLHRGKRSFDVVALSIEEIILAIRVCYNNIGNLRSRLSILQTLKLTLTLACFTLKLPLLISVGVIEYRHKVTLSPHGFLRLVELNTCIVALKADGQCLRNIRAVSRKLLDIVLRTRGKGEYSKCKKQ